MIEVAIRKRLTTIYGRQELKVNTTLEEGGVLRITGASGSGKTTFLKIVAGLIRPEEGRIRVAQDTWLDTTQNVDLRPQQRKAGFVFQDYALFPNMTVREHLEYATRDRALIARLLGTGDLERLNDRKPAQLSGGQQQRLAILRALATAPRILLMDEPFSALDQPLRRVILADLKQLLADFNTTCMIATHYPDELDGLATASLEIAPVTF